jgi:hypothetical protein
LKVFGGEYGDGITKSCDVSIDVATADWGVVRFEVRRLDKSIWGTVGVDRRDALLLRLLGGVGSGERSVSSSGELSKGEYEPDSS